MRDAETNRSAGQTASNGPLIKLILSIFSNRIDGIRYENRSENKQENNIYAHFSKSGRFWGPESAKNAPFHIIFTLPHFERHISEGGPK